MKEADTFTLRAEAREDWDKLFSTCAGDAEPERIVYLWNLDAHVAENNAMGTDALLHLAQALEAARPTAKLCIDSVTRGAQPAGREAKPTNIAQSPAIGLMRVILNEYPNYVCRGIDLPPTSSEMDAGLLWSELLRANHEREVAFRGEARYVQRLDRGRPRLEQSLDPAVPLRLESHERGQLNTLRFAPFEQRPCGPDEVLVDVKAAGMNFRDVLKALALYPGEAPDARIFGDEVSGVVVDVGSGVTHVKPGDRVFGLAVFGLATQTTARGSDVRRIPDRLSFEEAATLPVVFMTSWHALRNVARLRKGETVLIHAGAGGVGMAAIQIAHHLGAEVIASAGSPAKRALLETLGVKHVIDSRRGDFVEAVMALTSRRGVDVVLNALAGEAIPMGLACLAEFGRFIEIGKRDIYQNSRIPLRPLRANASFHVVAMDSVFAGDKSLTQEMLAEIADLIDRRDLHPLPFRAFPANNVDAAFRLMAGGKHIGKVIVSFPEALVLRRGEPLAPKYEIRSDGCYLVTGAFGGFGTVIANWLVQCGARHLVLCSRSGASTAEAETFVQSLRNRGVEVQVVRADIGVQPDVAGLFTEIRKNGRPLRGVFHLAMVIDDAPLAALTRERMATVIGPKALGAWLLHEGTRAMDLDCFVMFSSVSSIFGNPAQGNYAAVNAFLDSLAHHRQALGLPALTINWGVLGGEGYVARNERVAEFLAKQGIDPLSPGEVTSILESSLRAGSAQVAAIRVDWTKWRTFFRGMQSNPLLERIFAAVEGQETNRATSDWRQRIEAALPEEKESVIAQAVREVVGAVLRVKPDTLRNDQPLTDLGLDSLMGVEIENSLEAAIGVALPPTSLMRARTIGQIATLMVGHVGGSAATATSPIAASAPITISALIKEPPASAVEVDLDALSGGDIDRLIGDDEDCPLEATPMSEAKRARFQQWLESGEASLYPLTFSQRELWEASPAPAGDVSNHICCVINVRGQLSPEDCFASVQRVVNRQEVLRLSVLPGKNGPVQLIRRRSEPVMRFRDLPSNTRPEEIEELELRTFYEPFDLIKGPLYRVEVLRRAPDDQVMVFAIHHAIADGWTLGVFVQDLCAAYVQQRTGRPNELAAVPTSYSAWGAAERTIWKMSELEPRIAFWKSRLAQTPRLWTTLEQPSVIFVPRRLVSQLPAEITRAVRELARRNGATLFSTLLAAFQVALSRWTGEDDIIVGTPVANRTRQDVRDTMGYFSGVVPLRGQVEHDRDLSEHVRLVHQTTVDSFANAIPFAELVRALNEAPTSRRNPIFEVRFALQNHPVPDVEIRGLSLKLRMRSTGTPRFDLGCEITEHGEALEVVWLFRESLFSEPNIEELDRLFRSVLENVCRLPERRAAALTT